MKPANPTWRSSLLISCPEAEAVVGVHRDRLDRSARFGVPAHLTVVFPFIPPAVLTTSDTANVELLLAGFAPFSLVLTRTAWFGKDVVYLAPEDPAPVTALIDAVSEAFPAHPPYEGQFPDPVPHVTIGHVTHGQDASLDDLRAAEADVRTRLPVRVDVTHVELWAGPPLEGPVGPGWCKLEELPLG